MHLGSEATTKEVLAVAKIQTCLLNGTGVSIVVMLSQIGKIIPKLCRTPSYASRSDSKRFLIRDDEKTKICTNP
jgi:hypothetical protein